MNSISSNINIYVLSRIQVKLEQRINESLFQSKGVNKEKNKIINQDLGNSSKNLENLYNRLISKNIDKVLFVSSPYLSKRVKLIWDKFSNKISINFYKTIDWPSDKLRFFEKLNKKRLFYINIQQLCITTSPIDFKIC